MTKEDPVPSHPESLTAQPVSLDRLFSRTKTLRKKVSPRVLIVSSCALFVALFSFSPAAQNLDLSWYQLESSYAGIASDVPPVSFVLEAGDKTSREMGAWPWTRESLAYFIRFLSKANVRAIFVDDSLVSPAKPAEDELLESELMKEGKKIYLKSQPETSSSQAKNWIEPPPRFLIQTQGAAHLQVQKMSNGISRYWIPVIKRSDGTIGVYAAFKLLANEFPKEASKMDNHLRLDRMLIPWNRGDLEQIPRSEIVEWLKKFQSLEGAELNQAEMFLSGRVIWIGPTTSEFETPPWLEPISKVRLAAMLFEQMRNGKVHAPLPAWGGMIVFILSALGLISLTKQRGLYFWIACVFLAAGAWGASWAGLRFFQIYGSPVSIFIFVVSSAIGILIQDLWQAEAERKTFFYLATRDGLTDLYGIRHFRLIMNQLAKEAANRHEKLALIILDLDHFKKINDTFGHPAGDEVIKRTAEVLVSIVRQKRSIQEVDFIARYGGEEFMVLIRNADLEEVKDITERIREAIESSYITWNDLRIYVTVSAGISYLHENENIPDAMVHRADKALYLAKQRGRNRVCTENDKT